MYAFPALAQVRPNLVPRKVWVSGDSATFLGIICDSEKVRPLKGLTIKLSETLWVRSDLLINLNPKYQDIDKHV